MRTGISGPGPDHRGDRGHATSTALATGPPSAQTFGLSGYTSGSFTQVHPAPASGANNCSNPGVNGDDGEAILDAEWASAAAPSAAIELASCADTSTTFGGLIALQNLINNGDAARHREHQLRRVRGGERRGGQRGVQRGVSAGGGRGHLGVRLRGRRRRGQLRRRCRRAPPTASASAGLPPPPTTWRWAAPTSAIRTPAPTALTGTRPTPPPTARRYPTFRRFPGTTPAPARCSRATSAAPAPPTARAASATAAPGRHYLDSRCRQRRPERLRHRSAVNQRRRQRDLRGICQALLAVGVVGIPNDGVRDIPDVSLFAANGVWGHYYVFCCSDTRNGGAPCTGAPSSWAGAGGTSFASPIMAGIQALVNQKYRAPPGQSESRLLHARRQRVRRDRQHLLQLDAMASGAASSCIFYDVTQGDMDVNCTGTHNCYLPSGKNGVLSTSAAPYSKAYGATTGWDFATGIGTVNANNLVNSPLW